MPWLLQLWRILWMLAATPEANESRPGFRTNFIDSGVQTEVRSATFAGAMLDSERRRVSIRRPRQARLVAL
eukprot:9325955-Prorocentrum_lima.AAC.1